MRLQIHEKSDGGHQRFHGYPSDLTELALVRRFRGSDEGIRVVEDCLAERSEFELGTTLLRSGGYRFAVTVWWSEVNSNCRYRFFSKLSYDSIMLGFAIETGCEALLPALSDAL